MGEHPTKHPQAPVGVQYKCRGPSIHLNLAGGPHWLMDDLEMSRALGDLQYRPFSVIAEPDITRPWRLDARDSEAECKSNTFVDAGGMCVSGASAVGKAICLQ